jgi:hypothetical protein
MRGSIPLYTELSTRPKYMIPFWFTRYISKGKLVFGVTRSSTSVCARKALRLLIDFRTKILYGEPSQIVPVRGSFSPSTGRRSTP